MAYSTVTREITNALPTMLQEVEQSVTDHTTYLLQGTIDITDLSLEETIEEIKDEFLDEGMTTEISRASMPIYTGDINDTYYLHSDSCDSAYYDVHGEEQFDGEDYQAHALHHLVEQRILENLEDWIEFVVTPLYEEDEAE